MGAVFHVCGEVAERDDRMANGVRHDYGHVWFDAEVSGLESGQFVENVSEAGEKGAGERRVHKQAWRVRTREIRRVVAATTTREDVRD